MRAVTIIIRFVQLLAIIPVALGLANAGSFFELLDGLAQGQPWDFAEFARRLAAFSIPTALGVALIAGLQLLLRQGAMTDARALRYPREPWLWKPMWAGRRICLSNRTAVAIGLAALGIFGFVIVPAGLWMASQRAATVVYVFLGVTGALLLAMIRMLWLNRRWGRSELEILTLPGVIGGPFRGRVIVSEYLPEGTAFRVTLKCIRHRTARMRPSGKTCSVTDTLWQDQKILFGSPPADRPDAVAIVCPFAIPIACEPTSLNSITVSGSPAARPGERLSIHWQLSVGMKDTLDLRQATFEVPVFRTESSSPDYQEDTAVDVAYLEPVDVDTLLESMPLRREYSASGERLRFSLMPTRDCLWVLAFALAVSFGVGAIFRYVSMPLALFAAFLPAALALLSFCALAQWLAWKAEIEITPAATTFTAGYLWSRRRYEFPRGKPPTLECHVEFHRADGSSYSVRLVPEDGPPCDIVRRLVGKQNAVAVREWLMTQLGAS